MNYKIGYSSLDICSYNTKYIQPTFKYNWISSIHKQFINFLEYLNNTKIIAKSFIIYGLNLILKTKISHN
jgi:hypothetical protein